MKTKLLLLSIVLLSRMAAGQNYLEPEPGILGQLDPYEANIRQVFASAYDGDVVLRVVIIASFRPEEIAGIRKTEKGYEAFAMKPSSTIWHLELVRMQEKGHITTFDKDGKPLTLAQDESYQKLKKATPADVHQITALSESAPLPAPLAERISHIWRKMLLDSRHPKSPSLGADGATYHFSMWIQDYGAVSASIWSPHEHTPTAALVNLGYGLADFARDKSDAAKLAKLLKPLE